MLLSCDHHLFALLYVGCKKVIVDPFRNGVNIINCMKSLTLRIGRHSILISSAKASVYRHAAMNSYIFLIIMMLYSYSITL